MTHSLKYKDATIAETTIFPNKEYPKNNDLSSYINMVLFCSLYDSCVTKVDKLNIMSMFNTINEIRGIWFEVQIHNGIDINEFVQSVYQDAIESIPGLTYTTD